MKHPKLFLLIVFLIIVTIPSQSQHAVVDYSATEFVAKDISWIPLGNSKGHMMAIEAPAGLPIISSLRSHITGPTVIKGEKFLSLNYSEKGKIIRENWRPWAVVFADGMQPVVGYKTKNGDMNVVWPSSMQAISRKWIENTNILQTVSKGAAFELTTVDFVASEENALVRKFSVRNTTDKKLSIRLFHYAPINASGINPASWTKDWHKVEPKNNASFDSDFNCLVFNENNDEWWITGSDKKTSGYQCDNLPGTQKSITSGKLSSNKEINNAVVDAALSFDSPELAPGESYEVTIYVTKITNSTRLEALQQFSKSYMETEKSFQAQTLDFWKDWLSKADIPATANPEIKALVERLLMILKASSWEDGEISAVPAELSQFYTRDAMRPAVAFALFGLRDEAKNIILSKEAYIEKYGIQNHDVPDSDIAARMPVKFDENTRFAETRLFSVDDPALILYAMYHIWQTDTSDTEFIKQTWPLVQYILDLGKRDFSEDELVAQNSGFQDDMLKWAFGRGYDIHDDEAGIVTSYFNMLWSVAFDYGSQIAQALGKEHIEYKKIADHIKTTLESKYWSDSLGRYAYFYDPSAQPAYYRGTKFIALKDDNGGQYVFPDKPLVHGITLPYWFNYDNGEHALKSFELAKSMIEPLPESLALLEREEMAVIYIRYLYAKIMTGNINHDEINWFVKQIPLAGVPESFPTNNRAVQTWVCGEALIMLHAYLQKISTE